MEKVRLKALWKQQYAEGMSLREIAADSGRSYGMVHKYLSEAQVEFRSRGGKVGPRS